MQLRHTLASKMRSNAEVHGALVVDKPLGPTSHDVVSQARKVYGTRRVGHTGTLDPMATGVLVLLFGEATKLSSVLSATDKTYVARVVFGASTDSNDAQRVVTSTASHLPDLADSRALVDALNAERERLWQVPPAISAIKQNGERAYKTARMGLAVSLEPRAVRVFDLRILAAGLDYLDLELHCSKGYYVRALARDLGECLGCPAHLGKLQRVWNGTFRLESAMSWPPTNVPPLLPLVEAVRHAMPTGQLTENGVKRARCGQKLTVEDFKEIPEPTIEDSVFAWLFGSELIALGEYCDDGMLRVTRGFAEEP